MKKVRIAHPMKLVRSLVLVFLTVYLTTLMFTGSLLSVGDTVTETIHYTVVEGDTLWTISKAYTPEKGDVRETLYTIKSQNQQLGDLIKPGDIILVPYDQGGNL